MCGNVGVVLKNNSGFFKQTEDVFIQLLYADALRGEDSTGVIAVEKDNTFHIAKEASEASWFNATFFSSDVQKKMWRDGKAYIGHNRKGTQGAIIDKNAHPFVINDTFALVHNGTLYNHEQLAKTDVDSEALAMHLAKCFDVDNPAILLQEQLYDVYGAYAIAMYSQKKHSVYLLRNKERPLTIIETPNAWYWASEGNMLAWILSRNGYDMKDCTAIPVPEHELFTFDLEKSTLVSEKITVKKATPLKTTTITRVFGGIINAVSKNEYKRARKKHIGTRVEFWAKDFVEQHFPKTEAQGETSFYLMGEAEAFEFNHTIRCIVDLKNFPHIKRGADLCDVLWNGRVEDFVYDLRGKKITVVLKDVKESIIIDGDYIAKKLDEREVENESLKRALH